MSALVNEVELIALPPGTVIAGPGWHEEVYRKSDTDVWYGIGSEVPWTSRSLVPRGPFRVLELGGEPVA